MLNKQEQLFLKCGRELYKLRVQRVDFCQFWMFSLSLFFFFFVGGTRVGGRAEGEFKTLAG